MKNLLVFLFVCITRAVCAQNSATGYIEQYKELAIKEMREHGVPASIVLGVAMHESGNGTSRIARVLNNHFGMKGPNYNQEMRSRYKSYDSAATSYADFSMMLKSRKRFSPLFDTCSIYDYKAWVLGMQRGRYAANKAWASRVVAIIKKYNLYEYDNRPADYVEPTYELFPKSVKLKQRVSYHRIKKGDTLSALAKKYGTRVDKIRHQNHLKTDYLRIGQKLKI